MSRQKLKVNPANILIATLISGGENNIPPTSGSVDEGTVISGTIDAISTCNEGLTWDIEETASGIAVSFTFAVAEKGQRFKAKGKSSTTQDYTFEAWNGIGWDSIDTFEFNTVDATYSVGLDEAYTISNEVKVRIYRAAGTNEKLYLDCITILDEVPPGNARLVSDGQGRITSNNGWRVINDFSNLSAIASPDWSTEIEVYDTVAMQNMSLQIAQIATLLSGVGVLAKYVADGSTWATQFIDFDTEIYDPLGFHDLGGDISKFTVPTGYAGRYAITASTKNVTGTSSTKWMFLYHNGVSQYFAEHKPSGHADATSDYTLVAYLDLSVGDYVQVNFANQLRQLDTIGITFSMWRIGENF